MDVRAQCFIPLCFLFFPSPSCGCLSMSVPPLCVFVWSWAESWNLAHCSSTHLQFITHLLLIMQSSHLHCCRIKRFLQSLTSCPLSTSGSTRSGSHLLLCFLCVGLLISVILLMRRSLEPCHQLTCSLTCLSSTPPVLGSTILCLPGNHNTEASEDSGPLIHPETNSRSRIQNSAKPKPPPGTQRLSQFSLCLINYFLLQHTCFCASICIVVQLTEKSSLTSCLRV